MKNIDHFPKSIKKAVRYSKQEASIEQLEEIQNLIYKAIKKRKQAMNQ